MGPENGLERRVWQFYTICDKNQLLKVKKKVAVIPVPKSWDISCKRTICHKILKTTIDRLLYEIFTLPAYTVP
jgi:hypothetical protein